MKTSGSAPNAELSDNAAKISLMFGIMVASMVLSSSFFAVNICPLDKTPTEIIIQHSRHPANIPIGVYDNTIDVIIRLDAVQRETGERTPLANKELLLELTIGSKFITKSGNNFILSDEPAPFPINTSGNGTIHFTIYTQQPLLNDSVNPKKISYAITASYVPKPKEPLMGSAKTERYVPGVFPIISMSACLPLFMVIALLVAAMFATGKNPFGLFDFTRVAFKAPTIARKQVTTRVKSNLLTNVAAGVAKARLKMLSYSLGEKLVAYSNKVKGSGKTGIAAKLAGFVTGTAGKMARKAGTRRISQKEKLAMAKEKVKSGNAETLGQALKQVKQKLNETGGGRLIDVPTSKGQFKTALASIIAGAISQMGYRPWSLSAARAPTPDKTYSKKEQKEMEDNIKDSINWTKVAEKLGMDENEAKNKIKADGRGLTLEAKLMLARATEALSGTKNLYLESKIKFDSEMMKNLGALDIKDLDKKIKEVEKTRGESKSVSDRTNLKILVDALNELKKEAIRAGEGKPANWDNALKSIEKGMKAESALAEKKVTVGEFLNNINTKINENLSSALNSLNLNDITNKRMEEITAKLEAIKQREGASTISDETRAGLEKNRKSLQKEKDNLNELKSAIVSNWRDTGKELTNRYNEVMIEVSKMPNDRIPLVSAEHALKLENDGILIGKNYTYHQELKNLREELEMPGSTLNNLAKLYGIDTQLLSYLENKDGKGNPEALKNAIAKLKDNPDGMAILATILNGPAAGYVAQVYGNRTEFEAALKTNFTIEEKEKELTEKVISSQIAKWGDGIPKEVEQTLLKADGANKEEKLLNIIYTAIPEQQNRIIGEKEKLDTLKSEYSAISSANFSERSAKRTEIEKQEFAVSKAEGDLYRMEKGVKEILDTREMVVSLKDINEYSKNNYMPEGMLHPSTIHKEVTAEKAAWASTYAESAKEMQTRYEKGYDEYHDKLINEIKSLTSNLEKVSPELKESILDLAGSNIKSPEMLNLATAEGILNERESMRNMLTELNKKTSELAKDLKDEMKRDAVITQEERSLYSAIQTSLENINTYGNRTSKEFDKAAGEFIDKNASNPVDLTGANITHLANPGEYRNESIAQLKDRFDENIAEGVVREYFEHNKTNVPNEIKTESESDRDKFVTHFFGVKEIVGTGEVKPSPTVGTGSVTPSGPAAEPPPVTTPAKEFKPPKEKPAEAKKEEPKIGLASPAYEKTSYEIESQTGGSKVTKEQKGELSWAEDQKRRDEETERRRIEFERKVKETATAAKEKVADTAKSYKEDVTTIWEWAKSKVKKEKEEK